MCLCVCLCVSVCVCVCVCLQHLQWMCMHVKSTLMSKKCKKMFLVFFVFLLYSDLHLKPTQELTGCSSRSLFLTRIPACISHMLWRCVVCFCAALRSAPLTCIVMAERRAPFCRYFLACTALLHRAATRWQRRLVFSSCGPSQHSCVTASDSSSLLDAVLKALSFFFSLFFLLGRISRNHWAIGDRSHISSWQRTSNTP